MTTIATGYALVNSNTHIPSGIASCYKRLMIAEEIRLKNLVDLVKKYGSITAVANLAGTAPAYLSQIINRVKSRTGKPRDVGPDLARKIENGCGKESGWMDQYHPQENIVQETSPTYHTNVQEGPALRGKFPVISWVIAGEMCETTEHSHASESEEWWPCPVSCSEHTYILRIEGDSMSPEYREGDLIFVDPDINAKHNDDVVIRTPDGRATFKRLQHTPDGKFLVALNPQFPERIVRVPEGTVICGTVVFSGRDRRR